MAQGDGLSFRQKQFLGLVLETPEILRQFYLSGGTALSSWYLHHRESYDLDFFSDKKFDGNKIAYWIKQNSQNLEYQSLSVDDDFGFYSFLFRFTDNSRLLVDFANYTPRRLKEGLNWQGLVIDSVYDIAVNKIRTVCIHPRERDYIDLYCILKNTDFTIEGLIRDAEIKFSESLDLIRLAANFLRSAEITEYPKMLIQFNKTDMNGFYEELVSSLKTKILE